MTSLFLVGNQCRNVTIPLRPPPLHQLFRTISILASDHLVVPIGVSHISSRLQEIRSREWEKKNKRTNKQYAWINSKCKKRGYVTLCIPCRLTVACISSKNSTKLEECCLILTGLPSLLLDPISSDWSFCCPVSTPSATFHRPSLPLGSFVQLSDGRSLSTYGRVEISSPNPLSAFAPKQTKGSSAWRTIYIVSQEKNNTTSRKSYKFISSFHSYQVT